MDNDQHPAAAALHSDDDLVLPESDADNVFLHKPCKHEQPRTLRFVQSDCRRKQDMFSGRAGLQVRQPELQLDEHIPELGGHLRILLVCRIIFYNNLCLKHYF